LPLSVDPARARALRHRLEADCCATSRPPPRRGRRTRRRASRSPSTGSTSATACASPGRSTASTSPPTDARALVYDYKGRVAPPGAKWLEEGASSSRSTPSPPGGCSTSSPSARCTSRSAPRTCARAGSCATDADPELVSAANDRRDPKAFAALLDDAVALALGAAREAREGALEPAAGQLRVRRRLRVPDDLPLRGRVSTAADLELLGPGGRPFTAEQARAVLDTGGDLLLLRAAGSGKTSVLVERFARHVVEEGVPPSRILAVTFTEKAAGELRRRVRDRLAELGRADAARDADGRVDLDRPRLCARLLRGHAVAAGWTRGSRAERGGRRDLRDAAWDAAFAAWLGDRGDAALDLAAAFTADNLRAAIEDVYDVLRSQGQTRPRLPVPEPAAAPGTAHPAAPARPRGGRARSGRRAGHRRQGGDRARTLARRPGRALGRGGARPGGARPAVLQAGQHRRAEVRPVPGLPGRARALRRGLRRLPRHPRGRRARRAARRVRPRVRRRQARARRADFDDLELFARDLLAGAPVLRDAYRERFERILVDEFQDSNPSAGRAVRACWGAGTS
jgi:hypothetical protein